MDSQIFCESLRQTDEGKKYLSLIEQAQSCKRSLEKEKGYEIHHIHTKALGGSNESSNLVKLSVFEHILAHYYLALAIPCRQTLYPIIILSNRAVRCLSDLQKVQIESLTYWSKLREDANKALLGRICINNGKSKRYVFEDELSEYLEKGWTRGNLPTTQGRVTVNDGKQDKKIRKSELEKYLKEGWSAGSRLRGRPSGRKGKHVGKRKFVTNGIVDFQVNVDELESYFAKGYRLGRKPFDSSTRQKLSKSLKGRKLSEEERLRRHRTGTGRVWCHLGSKSKWVEQSEFSVLEKVGWKLGRKEKMYIAAVLPKPKLRKPVSEETRKKQSLARKGRKLPEGALLKMRSKRWVKDGKGNQLRIEVSELQSYLDKGWIEGRYSSTVTGLKSVYWPESGKKKYVREEELPLFLEKGWLKGHPTTNCKLKKSKLA